MQKIVKILLKFDKDLMNYLVALEVPRQAGVEPVAPRRAQLLEAQRERVALLAQRVMVMATTPALFPRLGLGWINADFRVQIRIFQHFSSSTRKSSSREQISAKF